MNTKTDIYLGSAGIKNPMEPGSGLTLGWNAHRMRKNSTAGMLKQGHHRWSLRVYPTTGTSPPDAGSSRRAIHPPFRWNSDHETAGYISLLLRAGGAKKRLTRKPRWRYTLHARRMRECYRRSRRSRQISRRTRPTCPEFA